MSYPHHKLRTMRLFLFIPAFFSLILTCASARKPNVVIFFTDDQGTLDAGCYGSGDLITPNIDKLARTGVLFTQAYAHTVCCPARAALLTGRYPQRSGVNRWTQGDMNSAKGVNMALEEVTIAEALKPHGYRNALFGNGILVPTKTLARRSRVSMNSLVFGMVSLTTTTTISCTVRAFTTFMREPNL